MSVAKELFAVTAAKHGGVPVTCYGETEWLATMKLKLSLGLEENAPVPGLVVAKYILYWVIPPEPEISYGGW